MKRVKVLVSIAGSWGSYSPGQVVDMDDAEAEKWVLRGHGEILPSLEVKSSKRGKKVRRKKNGK